MQIWKKNEKCINSAANLYKMHRNGAFVCDLEENIYFKIFWNRTSEIFPLTTPCVGAMSSLTPNTSTPELYKFGIQIRILDV